jgi:hypothetical protein
MLLLAVQLKEHSVHRIQEYKLNYNDCTGNICGSECWTATEGDVKCTETAATKII